MSKPPNTDNLQADSLGSRGVVGQDVQSSVRVQSQTSLLSAMQESRSHGDDVKSECEKLEPDVDKKRHLRGISGRRQAVEVRGFWSKAHLSANRTFSILQMKIHHFLTQY